MNKKNLQKLATFLAYGDLPEDVKFDMGQFTEDRESVVRCETAGCAVGFAPFAGIRKKVEESFVTYSERVFGLDNSSREWSWCFNGDWSERDNTPLGAAKRIQYLLDNGTPPSKFKINEWQYITAPSKNSYKKIEVKKLG